METKISSSRILDLVTDILKTSKKPMLARELCDHLFPLGVRIEKSFLNKILWSSHGRPGLKVDGKTFQWRFELSREQEEFCSTAREAAKEHNKAAAKTSQQGELVSLLEGCGLEMLLVKRRGSDTPFFFLRNDDPDFVIVGPHGNLLREKADICTGPEPASVEVFTKEQIGRAIEEVVKSQKAILEDRNKQFFRAMRDTELLAGDVYRGPMIETISDSIPVSAVIFVENISRFDTQELEIAWGAALYPLYLVVNLLGYGVDSDERYGVYKLCVYELVKCKLITEDTQAPGGMSLQIRFINGKIALGPDSNLIFLETGRPFQFQ